MKTLKYDDKYTFREGMEGEIAGSKHWSGRKGSENDAPFKYLGLNTEEKRSSYIKAILGYDPSGRFPECNTWEDLTKLIEALQRDIDIKDGKIIDSAGGAGKVMEPKSEEVKVGDWVEILKGKANFNDSMAKFIGKIVQVTDVMHNDWGVQIEFVGGEGWMWESKNQHYRKVDAPVKKGTSKAVSHIFEAGDWVVFVNTDVWNAEMKSKHSGALVRINSVSASGESQQTITFEGSHWSYINTNARLATEKEIEEAASKFKSGDWVKLCKPGDGHYWNSEMDKYAGKVVQLGSMSRTGVFKCKDAGTWSYHFQSGHFIKAESSEIPVVKSVPKPASPLMKTYELGDRITFGSIEGKMERNGSQYFWDASEGLNDHPFELLKKDPSTYTKSVLGYYESGMFPYCNTKEDFTILVNALQRDIAKLTPKPVEGDHVTVCGLEGTLVLDSSDGYFWSYHKHANETPFKLIGETPGVFQSKILGYNHHKGGFPYCKTIEDIIKLIDALNKAFKKVPTKDIPDSFTFCDGMKGKIEGSGSAWYLNSDYLFSDIVTNKYEIQKTVLGYSTGAGVFPWCKTKEDVYTLCLAIDALRKDKLKAGTIHSGATYPPPPPPVEMTIGSHTGRIMQDTADGWYWEDIHGMNDLGFRVLNLDPAKTQAYVLGYQEEYMGGFPWCRTQGDAIHLVNALKKMIAGDKDIPERIKNVSRETISKKTAEVQPIIINVPKI